MKKAILYLNQFFGGIGGEDWANFEPVIKNGPIGPGIALQSMLNHIEITHTIICGDNFMNSHQEKALESIQCLLNGENFNLFVAGPAFQSGRYGMSCGAICDFVHKTWGVPAITCMNEENPGVDAYHENTNLYIIKGHKHSAKIKNDISKMASFANKISSDQEILWADAEGYFGHGIRKEVFVEKTSSDRAVDMLLAKISNQPFETEYKIETHDTISPAKAIKDIHNANIALVCTGGLVPMGNPDHIPSATASIWKRYPIDKIDSLLPGEFYSIHGGFSTNNVNEDPEVLMPLSTIKSLQKEGKFSSLHPFFYSTTGNLTSLKESKRMGSEIAEILHQEHVDGVIFVST